MPELPEVEVITRKLRSIYKGKKIKEVLVYSPKAIKGVSKEDFVKKVAGRRVKEIVRRGKAMLFDLDGVWLIVHLKINGQICLSEEKPAWARVGFVFEGKKQNLYLCDSRGLAEVSLSEDPLKEKFFAKMGPDPLSKDFTFDYFYSKIKKSRTKIKPLLMDQSFIAGVGNIYAVEALFRARIRPDRPANSLTEEEARRLYEAIKEVLKDSIKHGAVLKKYFVDGKEREDFSGKLLVYDREGEPCPMCGGKVVKTTLAGRGTYFCPVCQA